MKTVTKIVALCLLFVTLFFQSCSSDQTVSNDSVKTIEFTDFEGFPNSPFLDFNFESPISEIKTALITNDFLADQNLVYTRPLDSTAIILNDEDNLSTFKIYLKSKFYRNKNQDLFELLSAQSTKTVGTNQFAEMTFNTKAQSFKLTYFSTGKFIRISYQFQPKRLG